MSFPFALPTTSHLSLSSSLRCDSHPSLTLAATSARTVLRQALKSYKRLPHNSPTRASAIQDVQNAVSSYLPYILALDSGLSGRLVGEEEVVVTLTSELEVEWRPALATSPHPGRQPPRIKGRGLDYELLFVLVTGGYAHCLDARRLAATFYLPSSSQVPLEQRKAAVNGAAKALIKANSLFAKAQSVAETLPPGSIPLAAVDVQPAILGALASMCMSSASLLAVAKDDDFLTMAVQARDKSDNEWMYKAPDIPKVRANLFVRICIAASDHAAKGVAMLGAVHGAVREDFLKYVKNLQVTARARACRFAGIDAEMSGKLGDALAWLNAAKRQLGLPVTVTTTTEAKGKFKPSLTKMKQDWSERKERKGIEGKGTVTLDDARKIEEGRVLEMLEKDWSKTNDMIHHQIVADGSALAQGMPSAREIHSRETWVPPTLAADMLEGLRAPPEQDEDDGGDSDASDDEVEGGQMPGGYPAGTSGESGYF